MKLDCSLLSLDKKIFEDLEEGLNKQEKQWIRDKRDKLLDIAERIKARRLQQKLESQDCGSNSSLININKFKDLYKSSRMTLSQQAEKIKEAGRSRDNRIRIVKRMKEEISSKFHPIFIDFQIISGEK